MVRKNSTQHEKKGHTRDNVKGHKVFDPWEFFNVEPIFFTQRTRENLPSIWKGHNGFSWKISHV